jgi:predicted acyltransferase
MKAAERLQALDVFRGMTVAAMILVNNPGDWEHVYAPLLHSEWHGWTPADMVFAFFLFMAGASLPLSFAARRGRGATVAELRRQVLKRGALLLLLGLAVNGFTGYDWYWKPGETALQHVIAHAQNWRLTGVLQRIAIVYTVAGLLELHVRPRWQAAIVAALLLGYWAVAMLVPVPGSGITGLAALSEPSATLAAWIDRTLFDWGDLGNHLWANTDPPGSWDPEGPFSTLPAIATGMLGVAAGRWLGGGATLARRAQLLGAAGLIGVAVGILWDSSFPINKALWTSSYVLFTAGLAAVCLALLLWLVDLRGVRAWTRPFAAFGTNAILAYIGEEVGGSLYYNIGLIPLNGEWVDVATAYYRSVLTPLLEPKQASLVFALTLVLFWYLVLDQLYRRRIIIKL